MTSFYGSQTYSIDAQGRLTIPAPMRRSAGTKKPINEFMLVLGFEGCLALYTLQQWKPIEERLHQLPLGGRKARAFKRNFLMNATRVPVDSQGRITIPSVLGNQAGLGKEAVLLGQVNCIEIWEPQKLRAVMDEVSSHFEDYAEDVFGGS